MKRKKKENPMERIVPLSDHLELSRFAPGQQVEFHGEVYTVLQRTTLASGEPALVLQGVKEQFIIGAEKFLSGLKEKR